MSGIAVEVVEPGVAVVALSGEHETYSAARLDRQLTALQNEGLAIVVDLTETTFVDSAIISVLLRARESARELGVPLVLVLHEQTGWAVRRLFDVARLYDTFTVAPDRESAVATVSQ